jgi:hypothetical protein
VILFAEALCVGAQNGEKLDSVIIYDRDFDYDYFGFKVRIVFQQSLTSLAIVAQQCATSARSRNTQHARDTQHAAVRLVPRLKNCNTPAS